MKYNFNSIYYPHFILTNIVQSVDENQLCGWGCQKQLVIVSYIHKYN